VLFGILWSRNESIKKICQEKHGTISSVLNSDKAIQINIQIMRVFNRFKKMYFAYDELKKIIQELEQRQREDKRDLSDEIQNLSQILFLEVNRLDIIMKPSNQIGFKQ